jgi:transcriptional regulator with XRE-family HTH domain
MDTINKRIRYVRKQFCDDKNSKFAAALGENANTVNNWIRDGYNVGRGVASKISDYFNVSIEWLLTGEGEMLRNSDPENLDPQQAVTYKELYEQSKVEIYQLHEQIGRLKAENERNK